LYEVKNESYRRKLHYNITQPVNIVVLVLFFIQQDL